MENIKDSMGGNRHGSNVASVLKSHLLLQPKFLMSETGSQFIIFYYVLK